MTSAITLHKNENAAPNKWLPHVRRVWLVLVVILFITFLMSIPAAYTMLTTVCDNVNTECATWAQQTMVDTLAKHDISVSDLAVFNIIVFVGFSAFCWFAGLLVLGYRSRDWHGLLVSYLLITLAAGGPSFVFMSAWNYTDLPSIIALVPGLTIMPMYLALSVFFQTFPDGRIYPRWSVIGTILIIANYAVWILPPPINLMGWPPIISLLWLLFVFGFHIVIQAYRYRYHYSKIQRQQTKWLVFGAAIALVSVITSSIVLVDSVYADILEGVLTTVGFYLPIAAGVTIAILRYNLWDIDVIINRTLVYGVLTALLVGIYALIVSTLGLLIQDTGNFIVSLLGAGVIAVLFQPLRVFIQRAVNRWLFGQRDEPLAVMVELGKSLEMIVSPEAALEYLLETTAQSLKVPYVAIEDDETFNRISFGKQVAECERFPLTYQAEAIGSLLVSSRSPGESLSNSDRLVLENISRQASTIVHASRLTQDLQQSRLQILTTREEERRRLRRDLHDGLGPALATLTLQAEAAREWLAKDTQRSDSLLQEIISGSQNTLADIRRIVYALRPPALDDLGLIAAIQEQATQYSKGSLVIMVESPEQLPPLPAAIEVATYRIVQEALTNVARHAQAQTCTVCLQLNGKLDIEIKDNGIGIPTKHHAGVGLNSIHERAAELGGSCVIRSEVGGGTHILVSLPKE